MYNIPWCFSILIMVVNVEYNLDNNFLFTILKVSLPHIFLCFIFVFSQQVDQKIISTEIGILLQLNHPNIVSLEQTKKNVNAIHEDILLNFSHDLTCGGLVNIPL